MHNKLIWSFTPKTLQGLNLKPASALAQFLKSFIKLRSFESINQMIFVREDLSCAALLNPFTISKLLNNAHPYCLQLVLKKILQMSRISGIHEKASLWIIS